MALIHISQDRLDRILAQGHTLHGPTSSTADVQPSEVVDGGTIYHVLDSEHAICGVCNEEFDSVRVETPADLENEKIKYY